jgi:uncharacterized protein (TIRG00374 family)
MTNSERGRLEHAPTWTPVRIIVLGAVAMLVLVGVALLLGKAVGFAKLADELRSAEPEWLVLAFVAESLSFLGYGIALRELARFEDGPRLSVGQSMHIVFATSALPRLVSTGGVAGLALDYWALTRAGASKADATARVLALNVLFFATFGIGAWLAALVFVLGAGGGAPPHAAITWLLAVPLVFVMVLAYRAPSRRMPLGRKVGPWIDRMLRSIADAVSRVRRLLAAPRQSSGALVGTILYWLGDVLCLWAGLRAFHVDVTAPALILGYSTGYLLTLLPLPLGGVGAVDAGIAIALRGVGIPLAPALLGVLAYRLFSFWLPTLPGLVALSTLPALGRRLGRSASTNA